jgi:hypothetical protein
MSCSGNQDHRLKQETKIIMPALFLDSTQKLHAIQRKQGKDDTSGYGLSKAPRSRARSWTPTSKVVLELRFIERYYPTYMSSSLFSIFSWQFLETFIYRYKM